jgi:hypothetical protein
LTNSASARPAMIPYPGRFSTICAPALKGLSQRLIR